MNVAFWKDFFKWAESKALSLAKAGDFLGLMAFLGEIREVTSGFVAVFESLQTALKGNWLKVASNLLKWAAANPDPLHETRVAMNTARQKWGEVASGK